MLGQLPLGAKEKQRAASDWLLIQAHTKPHRQRKRETALTSVIGSTSGKSTYAKPEQNFTTVISAMSEKKTKKTKTASSHN